MRLWYFMYYTCAQFHIYMGNPVTRGKHLQLCSIGCAKIRYGGEAPAEMHPPPRPSIIQGMAVSFVLSCSGWWGYSSLILLPSFPCPQLNPFFGAGWMSKAICGLYLKVESVLSRCSDKGTLCAVMSVCGIYGVWRIAFPCLFVFPLLWLFSVAAVLLCSFLRKQGRLCC